MIGSLLPEKTYVLEETGANRKIGMVQFTDVSGNNPVVVL
jgi:hypothetical protein